MPQMPPESLLKNTLDPEENTPEVNKPSPAMLPLPSKNTVKREVQTAQRKLSEHLYYPPEAIAQGIEGEVRLILKLSADGAVEDINIAASSGHPVLDQAAIKAAYAMGKLVGATSHELILPVIFRLQ